MNNKILNICILVSIVHNIHAADKTPDLNEINTSIVNNTNNNVNNNITNLNNINTDITDNNKSINDYFNVKRTTSNVWTLANNNSKCWLMAAWDTIVPIFTQSGPKDPIRRTNYAEICKLLGWNIMDNIRSIYDIPNNMQDNVVIRSRNKSSPKIISNIKRVLKLNSDSYKEYISQDVKDYKFDENNPPFIVVYENQNEHKANRYDLKIHYRNRKFIGRHDLISTIINYFSNEDLQKKIDSLDKSNKVTKEEKKRREKILQLLAKMQDINYGGYYELAMAIIIDLFPELKQFIGSGYKKNDIKEEDPIMKLANNLNIEYSPWKCNYHKVLEEENKDIRSRINHKQDEYNRTNFNYDRTEKLLTEIESLEKRTQENNEKINEIKNKSYSKFNFGKESLNELYNYGIDLKLKSTVTIPTVNDNKYVLSNKQYLVLSTNDNINTVVNNYQYIKNTNGEQYELIGIFLEKPLHAVCFVKTGKSKKSWSGIDTSLNANDDGYALKDIAYKDDPHSAKQINSPKMRKLAPFIKNEWLEESMSDLDVNDLNEEGKKYFLNLNPNAIPYNTFKKDDSNNTHLAKVYKHDNYKPGYLLYKKV